MKARLPRLLPPNVWSGWAALGAAPEFYAPFEANALAWYKKYASQGLFLNHVIVDPPVDRDKPLSETRDVYVHVTKETDAGVYISGAKMMGTGSALTHGTFVAQNNASAARMEEGKTEDFALVCFVPMSAQGQKVVCRTPYESRAVSPFDAPISSRYDENDAVLIFDDVFVPWEDVLIYGDVAKAKAFYPASGFTNRYTLQAQTRLAVKMDFMCGLLTKAIAANGTADFRGVQASVGEVFAMRAILWSMTSAMALDPQDGLGGMKIPKLEYASASRYFASNMWFKVKEIFDTVLGGAALVVPSSYKDLQSPELRPLIDRYYRGTGVSAEERIKLYKLIWDVTGSEFGGRMALYERNYGGNQDQVRMDNLNFTTRLGQTKEFQELVDACMSDYDLSGWRNPTWSWDPQ
nr:4-hydroxyphenylacetate 3-hydroxylase C-terminal domain-containing protein [Deinococcus reticulitermitis]